MYPLLRLSLEELSIPTVETKLYSTTIL